MSLKVYKNFRNVESYTEHVVKIHIRLQDIQYKVKNTICFLSFAKGTRAREKNKDLILPSPFIGTFFPNRMETKVLIKMSHLEKYESSCLIWNLIPKLVSTPLSKRLFRISYKCIVDHSRDRRVGSDTDHLTVCLLKSVRVKFNKEP